MKYEEYINKLGFTDEELMIISDVNKKCREYFPEELSFARTAYDKGEEGFAEYLSEFSEKSDIPLNTLTLYIYLRLLEDTYKQYEKMGIDKSVFLATMEDFSVVSRLPLYTDEPFGISKEVFLPWLRRNVDCTIYRIGNLEFEIMDALCDMEIDGRSIKEGEKCIAVHIPRKVDFNEELCEDSYRRAREFFKKYYSMENMIFMCWSWLLYPWLCEVLPEKSSIVKFQKKFKIIKLYEDNCGLYSLFEGCLGKDGKAPIEDLPENTSLRRAAKKRLSEGGNLGRGLGIRL